MSVLYKLLSARGAFALLYKRLSAQGAFALTIQTFERFGIENVKNKKNI